MLTKFFVARWYAFRNNVFLLLRLPDFILFTVFDVLSAVTQIGILKWYNIIKR